MDAAFLGTEVLDAYDCTGDAICARPARVEGLVPDASTGTRASMDLRLQAMLASAAADLCQRAGMRLEDLAGERLFLVTPESAGPQGALELRQAWLQLHGKPADARQDGISDHATVVEALGVAAACLSTMPGCGALVLCGESWLGHQALARLDDADLLCSPSSDGVIPGEALVLLRLHASAPRIACAEVKQTVDRHADERPLGTPLSEALLALNALGDAMPAAVLWDVHANVRPFQRESEFLRRRHWALLPLNSAAWLNSAALGYVGRCLPLLQLGALAALPDASLPAVACARSLWRDALVSVRPALSPLPSEVSRVPDSV